DPAALADGRSLQGRALHAARRGDDPGHGVGLSPLRRHLRRGQRLGRRLLPPRRSLEALPRLDGDLPAEAARERCRAVLHELVRRTGLREAYIAMDCLRARPLPGTRLHPANAPCYLLAYAMPYVWLMPRETIERGVHLIISSTPRIPEACVDPRAK